MDADLPPGSASARTFTLARPRFRLSSVVQKRGTKAEAFGAASISVHSRFSVQSLLAIYRSGMFPPSRCALWRAGDGFPLACLTGKLPRLAADFASSPGRIPKRAGDLPRRAIVTVYLPG